MAGACNVEYNALKTAKPVHPFRESKPRPNRGNCGLPLPGTDWLKESLSYCSESDFSRTVSSDYFYVIPVQFETRTI